jgi:superfamily II DNA or RNA helicase
MNLKTLDLKKAYSSDSDDFLNEFYIPTLQASIEYNRLAGFFSSKSLAIAARGILGLIKNKGNMKLIMSPIISKTDLDIILKIENHEKYIENQMLKELDKIEDEFVRDHIFALGWMLANNKLEIKVAIAYDDKNKPLDFEDLQQSGLFHQKVGILKDSNENTISFSGSVNETAVGWLGNVEEFKVFRSWDSSEKEYVNADISKFNRFWNNQSKKVTVMDIPFAVKEKLIKIAPNDIDEINLAKWNKNESKKIKLFEHQEKAIESWIQNGKKGIFEMATGTGKTYTALGCLKKLRDLNKIVCIISCPGNVLVQQWKRAAINFGLNFNLIVADSSSRTPWKTELADSLADVSLGYKSHILVITTHNALSSNDFINIIKDNSKTIKLFLIGDEVHRLGAKKWSNGLIEDYDFRLGLSATPKRWFDYSGSDKLYDFFGGVVFKFGLNDAITKTNPETGMTYLTPYRYMPYFVSLNDHELEEYIETTRSIVRRFHGGKSEGETTDAILEFLLFKRADIIKNVDEKYRVLETLLDQIGNDIKWTIIYCSPDQIDRVMKILFERGIISHRFTGNEDKNPKAKYGGISERDFILDQFAKGEFKVLVAMKILDEGIDVPPARTAILMANSSNPLQYIQRIGRVIRRYPGKTEAVIHDLIVVPRFKNMPGDMKELEMKIFEKEVIRYKEISKTANNNVEALNIIDKYRF